MDQTSDIHRLCGGRLTILSGDDSLTLPLMALGAKGVVATVSNLMPHETHELTAAALARDYASSRELHYELLPLVRALLGIPIRSQ
jgi:4-hydroxy-tetrahydrodipicolinate synthase